MSARVKVMLWDLVCCKSFYDWFDGLQEPKRFYAFSTIATVSFLIVPVVVMLATDAPPHVAPFVGTLFMAALLAQKKLRRRG